MRVRLRFNFFFLFIVIFYSLGLKAQTGVIRQVRLSQFQLQSSAVIKTSPQVLSTTEYQPEAHWLPVNVPSTVLTGLVANKVYPDPYQGLNNMLIPDASDSFNKAYHLEQYSHLPNDPNPWKKPYWYRTTFRVPAGDKGRRFQLIFKGINYRAAVWLNGQSIADSSQMAGMFAEYSFDVSNQIKAGAENALAVLIYPLDYPGLPAPEQLKALGDFFLNGGPTGDIGKNVTMLCSVGWDWIPPVRDRNMGIWQPVYLRTTGNVTIGRTQIKTDLPSLPDTSTAKLSLKLSLVNHSNTTQKGKLQVTISPENFTGVAPISFSKDLTVSGSSSSEVGFNAADVKALLIHQPRLWWPVGYGQPNLYRIRLQYKTGNEISDDTSFIFGIRTLSSQTVSTNGSLRRDFYVNGKRVHLVGGAWVPDMMLNRDSTRYDHELKLCRNANVNLVRIWGGGVAPPDVFFEIADRYGLMVWQDFWITGDTQGEFKGSPDWPLQGQVFILNMTSTIYRIRNHASLLVWTGGNEGHARKELYDAMRDSVATIDGTRPFIPSSSGFAKLPAGWKGSWPDDQPSGVYSGGPYAWRNPAEYYKLADNAKDWVFKDETGLPSQPTFATLPKVIPNLTWDTTLPYPLNNTWGYHDACTGAGKYDQYYKEMVNRYGAPKSIKDFSDKMQLLNAIGYQGIFEAAGHKLNDNGGVMLWKLNAAFPSVIWQIYDWYLEPNAGYYFMQNACEPVHIQLNLDDSVVALINRTHKTQTGLTAQIEVYDQNSRQVFHQTVPGSLAPTEVKKTVSLARVLSETQGIAFIVLNIKDAANHTVSHNVYWMEAKQDYKSLTNLPGATVTTKIISENRNTSERSWTVQLTNTSDKVAFFLHPQITNGDEEIRPSFWSANYITLAPHEAATVRVSVPVKDAQGNLSVKVEGFNVKEQAVRIK